MTGPKSPRPSKSIALRKDMVKRLRIEKGWTAKDLARMTGCNQRTIENAEAGKPLSIPTVRCIATALDVDIKSLLNDAANLADIAMPGERKVRKAITIDMEYEKYIEENYQDEFIKKLSQAIDALNEIIVRMVKKGSVILEVEMSEDDWRKLEAAFHSGRLSEFGITHIANVPLPSSKPRTDNLKVAHGNKFFDSIMRGLRRAIVRTLDRLRRFEKNTKIQFVWSYLKIAFVVLLFTEFFIWFVNKGKIATHILISNELPDGVKIDSARREHLEAHLVVELIDIGTRGIIFCFAFLTIMSITFYTIRKLARQVMSYRNHRKNLSDELLGKLRRLKDRRK